MTSLKFTLCCSFKGVKFWTALADTDQDGIYENVVDNDDYHPLWYNTDVSFSKYLSILFPVSTRVDPINFALVYLWRWWHRYRDIRILKVCFKS